jgi:hypothetical protein
MKISRTTLTFLVASICFALSLTMSSSAASGFAGDSSHEDHKDRDRGGDEDHKHKKECRDDDRDGKDHDRDKHDDGRHNGKGDDDEDDACGCLHASAKGLAIQSPGVSLPSASSLLSAFSLTNNGHETRKNLVITSITLSGGVLTFPKPLPLPLGPLTAGDSVVLDADFSGGPFLPATTYPLVLSGTYEVEHKKQCFTLKANLFVPPAAPGSHTVTTVSVPSGTVTGAPYPHQPPAFDGDVNPPGWTVPTAPLVPVTPTQFVTAPQNAPFGDPPSIDFEVNHDWGIGQSGTAEPSGASGGGVVFVSSNWFAAYSTDGGTTFHQLDPTTIFPNSDAVGFCCDQIVQYAPSIGRFIWLLQGTGNRLAVASPADIISSQGTAWTYWNLTPDVFGESGHSQDYPDMALGDNNLYISTDVSGEGRIVQRTSLAGLQAGGTIEIDFTNPSDSGSAWGGHLSQDTGDEIFWAGQNSNNQMRIFSLKEGSNTYYWQDVGISTWANNSPLTSNTPDSQNWINFLFNPTTQNPGGGFPSNAVLGLTRSFNQVWFAWSAGTDNNFPRPHVEMVTLNIDGNQPPNLSVAQQVQIWNSAYTFAYPALATNLCSGEVGFSLEGGGDGNYESHLVGFWGDFVAYITTESNVGSTRFGDYVTIRQQPGTDRNPGNLFDAFGYGMNSNPPPSTGSTPDPHYVVFGRPPSSCQIIR